MTWTHPRGYRVTDNPERVDLAVVHDFLTRAYWSPGITPAQVARAMRHSLPFSLFDPEGAQVGYARVVTDRTSFGYLADVFVLEAHGRQGLGTWLVRCILDHPELATLRRWMLVTQDAHSLYARHGFAPLAHPERLMEYRPAANQPGASPA